MEIKKFLFIIFLFAAPLFAQTITDSILLGQDVLKNRYDISYDRQFYTHSLNSNLSAGLNSGNFNSGLLLNLASVVSKSGAKSVRDQNQFAFRTGYNLIPSLNVSVITAHENFKDTRETGLNFLSNTELLAVSKYTPLQGISSSAFYGIVQNKQLGDYERGNKYGLWGSAENQDEYDMLIKSDLLFERENINLRHNGTASFKLKAEKDFDSNISTKFYTGYHLKSRDYYIKADSTLIQEYGVSKNVLTREEEELQVSGVLALRNIYSGLSASLDGNLASKSVSRLSKFKTYQIIGENIFDSKLAELNFSINGNIDYSDESLLLKLGAGLNSRDEKHNAIPLPDVNPIFFERRSETEARKNSLAQRAFLSLYSEIIPSRKDRIIIQLFQNKLRYDTPSDNNYDDRDELLSVMRIRISRMLSEGLIVFISGEYTFSRLVYLFSEKSSNNVTGRLVKLNTGNEIGNAYFRSRNLFEVSANYSVYDFEDVVSGYKSFSFRQMFFSDSTTINLSKKIRLRFTGYYRLSEQAELKWNDFSIKPLRILEEILLFPRLTVDYRNANFSLGIRKFTISTFGYVKSTKNLQTKFTSFAPAAEIEFFSRSGLQITVRGWHEFNTTRGGERYELTNLNSEIRYFF